LPVVLWGREDFVALGIAGMAGKLGYRTGWVNLPWCSSNGYPNGLHIKQKMTKD